MTISDDVQGCLLWHFIFFNSYFYINLMGR